MARTIRQFETKHVYLVARDIPLQSPAFYQILWRWLKPIPCIPTAVQPGKGLRAESIEAHVQTRDIAVYGIYHCVGVGAKGAQPPICIQGSVRAQIARLEAYASRCAQSGTILVGRACVQGDTVRCDWLFRKVDAHFGIIFRPVGVNTCYLGTDCQMVQEPLALHGTCKRDLEALAWVDVLLSIPR